MGWNPFDRGAKDQQAIDDALVGFDTPAWQNASSSNGSTLLAREALQAWRTVASDAEPGRPQSHLSGLPN